MPRPRKRYPPEFRRQLIELARAGKNPTALAKEFEPSAQTIRTWMKQAERDAGQRTGRSNSSVRSCRKRPPGSPGRPARSPTGLRVREGPPGRVPGPDDVSCSSGLPERLLRLA
jgi:transposase-like protein